MPHDAEARAERDLPVCALHELRRDGALNVQIGAAFARIALWQVRHLRLAGPLFVTVQGPVQSENGS